MDVEGRLYYTTGYKRLEHRRILVSTEAPGNSPPQIPRVDCTSSTSRGAGIALFTPHPPQPSQQPLSGQGVWEPALLDS